MVTLQLGHPAPSKRVRSEPVARPVLVWVGVADSVLSGIRENLPKRTRSILDSAEMGFPPRVRINGDEPVLIRRIRYDRVALGYGIVIAQWMTIAPMSTKQCAPDYLSDGIARATLVLRVMGLTPRLHITDRPSI